MERDTEVHDPSHVIVEDESTNVSSTEWPASLPSGDRRPPRLPNGRANVQQDTGVFGARISRRLPCGARALKLLTKWLSFLSESESPWRVDDVRGCSLRDSLLPCGVAAHSHSLLSSRRVLNDSSNFVFPSPDPGSQTVTDRKTSCCFL